jgi:hypothetical protein
MPKNYFNLIKSVKEWSIPTAHTARVTSKLNTRTDLSRKANKPSVIQPVQMPFSKKEKTRKGIHGFQLGDK